MRSQTTALGRLQALCTRQYLMHLLLATLAYFALQRLGLVLQLSGGAAQVISPAAGAALGALLVGSERLWPAIAIGSLAADLSVGIAPAPAAVAALGGVVAAVVGARLLRRFAGAHDAAIQTVRGVCVLVAVGTLASAPLGALFGAAATRLTATMPHVGLAAVWGTFWLGDAIGILVVAPVVLAAPLLGREAMRDGRQREALAAMLAVCVVSAAIFASTPRSGMVVHSYFVFPPLLWAALRLRQPGPALTSFLLGMIATICTARGLGPFAGVHPSRGPLPVQAFLAITSLTAMTLAAVSAERRRAGEQLIRADRLAAMGTLAAGIAHEINNPLAYLIMCLEMISKIAHRSREQLTNFAQLEELLKVAQEGADKMRRIVGDMKMLGRNDDDSRGPVDVVRVLESSLELAWPEIQPRARLVKELGQVPDVDASPSRLGQVFLNLLINAAQAIPPGRVDANTIRISTRVDARGRVEISVSDSGSGIETHHRVHLFEPFYTTKAAPDGVGLGLSVCHALVQSFGGTIEVESELGTGSTFRVLLPPSRSAPRVQAAAPMRRPAAALSILIVEDETHLAESLALLLEEHEVSVALSGRQALDLCETRSFDLILCDLLMPLVTGIDVYEALRARGTGQHERIVFVTGGAFTAAAQQFLASIPNRTLEKPFATETLLQLVAQVGQQRYPPRSAE